MFKTLFIVLLSLFLVSSSLYGKNKKEDKQSHKNEKYLKHMMHEMKPLKVLMHLSLTKAQKHKIDTIVQKVKNTKYKIKNKQKLKNAFTESNFNEKMFVLALKQKSNQKIKKEFVLFKRIYAILTPAQKKELYQRLHTKKKKKK
ncbi:hypothetical protein MNB_SM-3-319 [hydrothermal vent metagenome]|uniref:Periplasmic protein n=1 Tax=hydrothermal vent metagenome TaxID=652676 RepID=A0A1W1D5T4_9ZZZZ